MKTPATLESLLVRVKKEVAIKAQLSEQKKKEAAEEIQRRKQQPDVYQREDLWSAIKIVREYEVQVCACCKLETTIFAGERIVLRHKTDRFAQRTVLVQPNSRWFGYKGESPLELPLEIVFPERVIPECFGCYTVGRMLQLFPRRAA